MNYKNTIAISVLILQIGAVFAQTADTSAVVKNYYDAELYNNLGRKEQKLFVDKQVQQLEKMAIREALFNAFPSTISTSTSMFMEDIEFQNFAPRTQSIYKSYTHHFANAELLKLKSNKHKHFFENDNLCIVCNVTITARKIHKDNVPFVVNTLDGINHHLDQETDFNHGQDFYIHFKTPQSGYLAVYLDDFTEACKLFPYSSDKEHESCRPVKADEDYILFSSNPKHDKFNAPEQVDELTLYANDAYDLNRVYIIFSKTKFGKPILEEDDEEEIEALPLPEGYALPKQTQSEAFMHWLQKNRIQRPDFQIKFIDISIKKRHK